MKQFHKAIAWCLVHVFFFQSVTLHAEAVDDKLTNISPNHAPGAGEFIHGQGYGKILVRVLMFGAIGQQGVHYVPEGTDLLFALLFSGGYSDIAKLNGITIRRKGVKDLIQVDLEDLITEGGAIPKLQDGDVITIPYSWRRDVETIMTITSFFTSIASFTATIVALITLQRTGIQTQQSLP